MTSFLTILIDQQSWWKILFSSYSDRNGRRGNFMKEAQQPFGHLLYNLVDTGNFEMAVLE